MRCEIKRSPCATAQAISQQFLLLPTPTPPLLPPRSLRRCFPGQLTVNAASKPAPGCAHCLRKRTERRIRRAGRVGQMATAGPTHTDTLPHWKRTGPFHCGARRCRLLLAAWRHQQPPQAPTSTATVTPRREESTSGDAILPGGGL